MTTDEISWAELDEQFAEVERQQEAKAFMADPDLFGPEAKCESGWTGDRCTYRLFHDGPHSN